MNLMKLAAASAFAGLMATAASAATLSYVGVGDTLNIANNDLGFNGTTVDYISGDKKNGSNGLFLSGPAVVTFTYLGYEAGNTNYSANLGGTIFENTSAGIGDTFQTTQGGGLIDFLFGTSDPASSIGVIANNGGATPNSPNFAIGYVEISSTSWYVFFDDIAQDDRDFDDMAMRIDVAPVPLPAAGALLLGGIGALGVWSRKRRKSV